ncbi:MAG: type II toxin-antitoxin system RelB/DinJ family antitoxin [Erysipelotrichaceae bacterium]|jgi:DNA-damage-inducible protein J|nr:type II toxin-antitoxin system RelB/DinJ family antitoxin [Erysipelotrichaceae bacterium]
MRKTASLCVRIDPEIKKQAEKVLEELGISVSTAINIFYKQVILHNGLPFEVNIPNKDTKDAIDEIHEMKNNKDKYKRYKTFKDIMDAK